MIKMIKQKRAKEPNQHKSLILWPGILILVLQCFIRFFLPVLIPEPETLIISYLGGLLGGLAIFIWWIFFSKISGIDRWGTIALIIASLSAASIVVHKSIATANMGLMFIFYSIPVMSIVFVVCIIISNRLSNIPRRIIMTVSILLASGSWILLRTDGITGSNHHFLTWRWEKTPEERLLENTNNKKTIIKSAPMLTDKETYWPGFRGPDRNGVIHGVKINTDWLTSPPVELWRRLIGPGCSSFAVKGTLLYTQEQLGENEVVACYNITTGESVWQHYNTARFWDSHAGTGPRSTPTLHNGRIYTLGATGILNVLDEKDGRVIWTRNPAIDINIKTPGWGFTSSPLIIDDIVIVALSGRLAAYDINTGNLRWIGYDGGASYSSPHPAVIDGILQILLMSSIGVTSTSPINGELLWTYSWPESDRILQPALTMDGDLLISSGEIKGIRRITVKHESIGWIIKERWKSNQLKSSFNDYVVHKDYIFGYSSYGIECIDIKNGSRKWKNGHYGGQLILLADQDLLIIISERGELALVEASPYKYTELARYSAIKGKTWNHPILAGNILLVRNANEMAAFRLALTDREQK